MYCPKCGFKNAENALECALCGIVFAKYELYLQKKRDEESREAEAAREREEEESAPIEEEPIEEQVNEAIPEEPEPAPVPEEIEWQCGYCLEIANPFASKCKHCGEFLSESENRDLDIFVDWIGDFKLEKMAGPIFARLLYALTLILGGVGVIFLFIYLMSIDQVGLAFLSIIVFLITLVSQRIFAELLIIMYRIEKNTRKSR